MKPVNVLCVKWGKKYGPEWVLRLRRMVRDHLSIPHRFICMTDRPIDGVRCVPCEPGLPSWWAKIGLFGPGMFPGWNLYLDLDVVLTDSIDALLEVSDDKVWARDDFSYSLKDPQFLNPEMEKFIGGKGTVNSSVMVWKDDAGADVWDKFYTEVMEEMHGDQNFISKALFPDKLGFLPEDLICSYKYHIQRGAKPAPVVVFHGNPKVTQLPKTDPLRKAWEA